MVLTFKLRAAATEEYPVKLDTFEDLTQNRSPWFQLDMKSGKVRRFGVCPHCDNPVQLKALVPRDQGIRGTRAHGAHVNRRVEGFAVFDGHKIGNCPAVRKGRPYDSDERQPVTLTSLKIRSQMIENFDRVMFVLKQDTGVNFSNRIAGRMLQFWLAGECWRYTGASLKNLPWMLALFAPSLPLKGQYLRPQSDLGKAMKGQVGEDGRVIVSCGYALSCSRHAATTDVDHSLHETIVLRVSDFSENHLPPDAPLIFRSQIEFDHDRFSRLLSVRSDHPNRNRDLLALAEDLSAHFPAPGLEE